MKITYKMQQDYIDSEGSACPFCASDDIEGAGVAVESGIATQRMFCNDCEESWEDVYTLSNVVGGE